MYYIIKIKVVEKKIMIYSVFIRHAVIASIRRYKQNTRRNARKNKTKILKKIKRMKNTNRNRSVFVLLYYVS